MIYDSRWEEEYASYLTGKKLAGEILDFVYSPMKIILGDKLIYLPDFLVILPDNTHQIHEVKGFQREDSVVKFKAAAAKFPFWQFFMVSKVEGSWQAVRTINSEAKPVKPKPRQAAPAQTKLSYAQMLQDTELSLVLQIKPHRLRDLRGQKTVAEISELTGIEPHIWLNLESGATTLYHYRHVLAIKELMRNQ